MANKDVENERSIYAPLGINQRRFCRTTASLGDDAFLPGKALKDGSHAQTTVRVQSKYFESGRG